MMAPCTSTAPCSTGSYATIWTYVQIENSRRNSIVYPAEAPPGPIFSRNPMPAVCPGDTVRVLYRIMLRSWRLGSPAWIQSERHAGIILDKITEILQALIEQIRFISIVHMISVTTGILSRNMCNHWNLVQVRYNTGSSTHVQPACSSAAPYRPYRPMQSGEYQYEYIRWSYEYEYGTRTRTTYDP